jgi:O-antigen ligase
VALGWYFGWDSLEPRMEQIPEGFQNREEMYDAARPMAEDYPLFGTGPGTFGTVFQLYRISNATYWPGQLHNDWLETRIAFGWFGMALLLAALACAVLRWFVPGGIRGGRRFVILAWLALAGCLVHARFDFPFQVHSIVFLFLLICAVLFSVGRRPGGSRR